MDTEDSGSVKPERMLRWTVTVLEDGEDLVLPLPVEMLETLGWDTGDKLKWALGEDGTWTLRKQEQSAPEDS